MIMAKEKINYQEVYYFYTLRRESKSLREFSTDYRINYDNLHELAASSIVE